MTRPGRSWIDRLTLNDDDKKVREWFIDQVKKYGCSVKVESSQ